MNRLKLCQILCYQPEKMNKNRKINKLKVPIVILVIWSISIILVTGRDLFNNGDAFISTNTSGKLTLIKKNNI